MVSTPTIHPSASSTQHSQKSPTCTKVSPGKYGHVPVGACNSNYSYNPSFAAAVAFSILFGLLTTAHIIQAAVYKKRFCWVIIMGSIWETMSFITRALGSHNQQNLGYVIVSNILLLLAPLWINAYVYMVLGRMVYLFLPDRKIYRVKAQSLAKYFVWLDIFSFIMQGTGGSMITPDASQATVMLGIHIYMGGIGLQEFFILVFCALLFIFYRRTSDLTRTGVQTGKEGWKALSWTLGAVLIMITIRIIYRLVEYAAGDGPSNPIPYHEGYAYGLDGVPMLVAISLLCLVHPGRILVGPESEFPRLSPKEKKELKRQKKEGIKQRKEERRRIKAERKGMVEWKVGGDQTSLAAMEA